VTEKEFMAAVLELARVSGWRAYHTHDSRRSEPGFPDLVMVRDGSLLFVELKVDRGVLSPAQREWVDALRGAGADVRIWWPSDWAQIEKTLARRARRAA
jgi:hypothetical protein